MSPDLGDHLRPTTDNYAAGVYRVVGTDPERVTLLRVTDADDRRVHTGEVIRVDRTDLDGFTGADEPSDNRGVTVVYWSLRAFLAQLAARPVVSLGALGVVLAGWVGETVLPDAAAGAAILVGGLTLAYVGSGRL